MKKAILQKKPVIKLSEQFSFNMHVSKQGELYVFKDYQNFERIYFISDKREFMGNNYKRFFNQEGYSVQVNGSGTTSRIFSKILKRTIGVNPVSSPVATPSQGNRNNSRSK